MRKGGGVMEAYCPICGKPMNESNGHRCSEKSLSALDAAMKSEHDHRENKKPFGRRLTDGFEMLRQHDDSYLTEDHWDDE